MPWADSTRMVSWMLLVDMAMCWTPWPWWRATNSWIWLLASVGSLMGMITRLLALCTTLERRPVPSWPWMSKVRVTAKPNTRS